MQATPYIYGIPIPTERPRYAYENFEGLFGNTALDMEKVFDSFKSYIQRNVRNVFLHVGYNNFVLVMKTFQSPIDDKKTVIDFKLLDLETGNVEKNVVLDEDNIPAITKFSVWASQGLDFSRAYERELEERRQQTAEEQKKKRQRSEKGFLGTESKIWDIEFGN